MRAARRASLRTITLADGTQETHCVGGHGLDRMVEIGSLTKTFTAASLDVLIAEGTVDPDAPVDTYLETIPAGTGITAALLAAHRSGLPRLPPGTPLLSHQPYARFDDAALSLVLQRIPSVMCSAPGHTELYSNLGYAVLGALLAAASGEDWFRTVRRTVLDPLDLGDVRLDPAQERRLVGATLFGRPRGPWQFEAMAPAGGLWATPRDLARYVRALVVDDTPCRAGPAWGRGDGVLWHNGATRDAAVFAGAHPATGVVVVAHTIGMGPAATDEMGSRLLPEGLDG